jgi:hypothetical protein
METTGEPQGEEGIVGKALRLVGELGTKVGEGIQTGFNG